MAPIARPKAQKPSRVVKPKKNTKYSTTSHRNHRFQPFSERIAKLKIDPIRRRRNAEEREEVDGEASTHFGKSLEEWRDLNMSQTFTAFVKDAAPLCESLPVLLHSEGKMMDLLVEYVEKEDSLAMEPLLSLLSSFAQDLDTRFEKHFQRAVSTVTAIAARHSDAAVVEWSFTCLAWLFKYLSRLLVPDLRPLYDLMAPYLGKDSQKPFIIRFAAESLSFLVRKAASAYERDSTPLEAITAHILRDCEDAPDLQRQGIMTLFTEAMRGVQGGLHSGGLAILKVTLNFAKDNNADQIHSLTDIIVGVLTSVIHHTSAETFRPVQDLVLAHVEGLSGQTSTTDFNARLIFTIASVRKGTRISNWSQMVSILRTTIELSGESQEINDTTRSSTLAATAVVLQSATIDAVLPNLGIFDRLRSGAWSAFFLQFCDLFARLGRGRFEQFLLPHFQKYVAQHWPDNGENILSSLPNLTGSAQQLRLSSPLGLQQNTVRTITNLTRDIASDVRREEELVDASRALRALPYLRLEADARNQLRSSLESTVRCALQGLSDGRPVSGDFALGACFEALLSLEEKDSQIEDLWPTLCNRSANFLGLPRFWTNLLLYLKVYPPSDLDVSHVDDLQLNLLKCLSMPSHDIRQSALDITELLYKLRRQAIPEVLSTAIVIESTPITFETSRRISMDVRRLSQGYSDPELDPFMQKAIPSYCFGLLHVKLTQAWDDASNVLATVSKSSTGEEVVTNLAQSWLDGAAQSSEDDSDLVHKVLDVDSDGFNIASDFECSNLARMSAICEQVFRVLDSGRPSLEQQLLIDHRRVPAISTTARAQALRALNKIPNVAEKRSRMLVPILLRWAGAASDEEQADEGTSQRWNRADQKAMLSVFAQFSNPRVLYKQSEVYAALLNLCSNGDVEIQRSALKALCAWKEPSVIKYEEHLVNLLDESRFREELSVFLHDGSIDDDDAIQPEDYPTLMPVLLRLVYGRAVAGGKQGQGNRRKAIFIALSHYGGPVLKTYIEIALGPLSSLSVVGPAKLSDSLSALSRISLRKQLGMVNMFEDMLETLGSELEPFSRQILDAALLTTISASRALSSTDDIEDASLVRSIRQAGIQCLVLVFASMTKTDLLQHAQLAFKDIVAPRLDKLPSENTQSVSGLLKLLSAWTHSLDLAPWITQQPLVLEKIAELLREHTAKDEVRLFVLQEVLDPLLILECGTMLVRDQVRGFTTSIGATLDQQPSKPVLDACVRSLTNLSGLIDGRAEAEGVLKVCAELLTKPGMIVSPTTKVGLLRTVAPLVENFQVGAEPLLYRALCGLFSRLRGTENRELLSSVLVTACKQDQDLLHSAEVCSDMNAVGGGLQDIDHERREQGFAKIYERSSAMSYAQWQPIIQNCLYYIRDADDMVNRSSASQALQRFVSAAALNEECRVLLADALLPGIESGLKAESELVRSEYLRILGHIVVSFPQWQAVNDMTALAVGGDDEASVFANILHIQQHRRLRALRRVADEATSLSSSSTTRFFIPLLEHFVFDQVEGDAGRTLSDQTIQSLGALAKSLTWPAYRTTFKRYVGYLSSKEDHEKAVLRLLGTFVDALATSDQSDGKGAKKGEVIIRDFLPPLTKYVHQKDESTIDRRMPVAVTIVKLLLILPETEMTARLAPVLSDVSHVLRSRSQEARDQTRRTLATVSSFVGPAYLGFILKELRSALQRGYQLHVLSFTVHSLLVNAVETCQAGDLDYCIPQLVDVVMDDIFGITGQEKDAEEYKSGMKEVKSSKSFDTMELLARITPVQKLGLLVKPLRDLLSQKLDSKVLKKIDDLLTRLRKGLDQNPAADTREMLVFCHEIVHQVHAEQQAAANPAKKTADRRVNRYLIQMESANKSKSRGATTSQLFKLASFALNLLRKVLRRHEDLMTSGNMLGFLPMAGDALVQGQEDVQTAAVKLLSTIMKLQMSDLDANAPVYVNESVRLIKGATSMTAESAKAALELITAVLREKRSVSIKDRDIGEVLHRLKAEIDEPDRQGIIYKFLRAVLGRKIMTKEVYELMDEVGNVVVTNPDRNVRESARSAYFQFVMEYPQGKDRWNKQAAFFVENLKYERPNGRQSVMELLNQLLSKIGDDVFKQLAFTLFVALVPVLANDEDRACRQMAGILIGKLIERAGEEQYELFIKLVDKWLLNDGNQAITIAALRCWMVVLRTRAPERQRIEALRDRLRVLIADSGDTIEDEADNAGSLAALQTAEVLMETRPDVAFAPDDDGLDICKPLVNFVMIEHLEAKDLAAKLIGAFFSHVASSSAKAGDGLAALPLRGAYGITLDKDDLRQMCYRTLSALRKNTEYLSDSISYNVRNLVFVGRCFAANGMPWKDGKASDSDVDEEAADDQTTAPRDPSALAYLLNRLSFTTRQESFPPTTRTAAITTQQHLLPHLPANGIPNLESLLHPLYLLTDPSTPQPPGPAHRALIDAARELLDAVQKHVGAEVYLRALAEARKAVGRKREERRTKRRVEAVSAPERWATGKRRKVEGGKRRRVEKGMEERGRRRGW